MNQLCQLCYQPIIPNSLDYVFNSSCLCKFHYSCYNKQFPNYFSIYFPKCPKCNKHYRKEYLETYPDFSYDEAFKCWIGNILSTNLICQKELCFSLSKTKYLNYCKTHFYEKYSDESAKNALLKIFQLCFGISTTKKFEILQKFINFS